MKRALPLPNEREIPAASSDTSRDDAQDTKKISREELEAVLKKTRSGTRRAVRSEPLEPVVETPPHAGPWDGDCSPSSIERIERIEFEIDPASLSAPRGVPASLPEASRCPASVEALSAVPARPLASVLMVMLAKIGAAIRAFARRMRGR